MFSTTRLVERIRAEYVALPGLKLTAEQACRLWGVGHDTCSAAFALLLAEGFLHQTGTGKYVALPRPAGAAAPSGAGEQALRCPHCGKRNSVELERTLLGHGTAQTIRCAGCQRILSVARRTA